MDLWVRSLRSTPPFLSSTCLPCASSTLSVLRFASSSSLASARVNHTRTPWGAELTVLFGAGSARRNLACATTVPFWINTLRTRANTTPSTLLPCISVTSNGGQDHVSSGPPHQRPGHPTNTYKTGVGS